MASSENNEELKIDYSPQTEQVTYSVADFVGNVIKRGDYSSLIENKLTIEDLPKGNYMLCIVDGDNLFKTFFSKN